MILLRMPVYYVRSLFTTNECYVLRGHRNDVRNNVRVMKECGCGLGIEIHSVQDHYS